MILLDTNVCIAFLRGHPGVVRRLSGHTPHDVRLCSIVKAELHFGLEVGRNVAGNRATLERFFEPYVSLPFDDACTSAYGLLRATLRRSGRTIGANDMLIAAVALAHGLTLVTHNVREFARVPDLRLEDWEEEL